MCNSPADRIAAAFRGPTSQLEAFLQRNGINARTSLAMMLQNPHVSGQRQAAEEAAAWLLRNARELADAASLSNQDRERWLDIHAAAIRDFRHAVDSAIRQHPNAATTELAASVARDLALPT